MDTQKIFDVIFSFVSVSIKDEFWNFSTEFLIDLVNRETHLERNL